MATVLGGKLVSYVYNCCGLRTGRLVTPLSEGLQVRNYAARKGTREKAKKKKVKVEVKKVGFIPHNLRKKTAPVIIRRIDDSIKPEAKDNVWVSRSFRWPTYDFAAAVECHRETHHPTVYNKPNDFLYVNLELDMRAAKANRFVDGFTRIVAVPNPSELESARSVLVFCKTHELQNVALEAGATLAGDIDLIKSVQAGDLNIQDFDYIVAHPNILHELVSIRGLMKKKLPNQKKGNLGPDIAGMVSKFRNGIEYSAKVDQYQHDFGYIFTAFGKLDMEISHLEENFSALLKDVNSVRPQREGPFITKCCLISLPSPERLKVDYKQYIDEYVSVEEEQEAEAGEEDESVEDETETSEKKKSASEVGS